MQTSRASMFAVLLFSPLLTAQGGLLVYEGFDYSPGELNGRGSVGYGMTGTWFADVGPANRKPAHTYRVLAGATVSGPGPWGEHWDGKLTELKQTGLYGGGTHHLKNNNNFDWADHVYGDRKIDPTVTALFAANLTTWVSYATTYIGHNNHYKPMLAIGAGVLSGSSPNLPTGALDRGRHATGQCIGLGAVHNNEGIRGIYWNDVDQDPNKLHERLPLTWPSTLPSDRLAPQVIVGKIEWNVQVGSSIRDRITVAVFKDTDKLTLANWNAATKVVMTTSENLDQSKFDTVSFSGSRYYLDELRIGTSFVSVVGPTAVSRLAADTATLSIAAGGTQKFTLQAGATHANRGYWVFGSATGTTPGVNLLGVQIPLNPDVYTDVALANTNSAVFTTFRGTLDAAGAATARLNVPANQNIPLGFKLYHAFIVYDTSTGQPFIASGAVQTTFAK